MHNALLKGFALAALAAAVSGCCSFTDAPRPYPPAPCGDYDFVSMFDGETFRCWQGDVAALTVEQHPYTCWYGPKTKKVLCHSDANAMVLTAKDAPVALTSRKTYEDFVFRFLYAPSKGCLGRVGFTDVDGRNGWSVPLKDELPAKDRAAWNCVEVRLVADRLVVMFNGFIVRDEQVEPAKRPGMGRVMLGADRGTLKFLAPRVKRVAPNWTPDGCPCLNRALEGFTALFDGKSLDGWKGVTRTEGFNSPWVRRAARPEKRAEIQAIADRQMVEHWSVRDGALFFDGKEGGYSLATAKDYGDFEMWCDWRILTLAGDSGFYPRGVCQVQIWDAHHMWHLGSGGLYNNKEHPRHGLEIADRQPGDWNRCYLKMVGNRVTVKLNGVTVVDDTELENAAVNKHPGPIPAIEQLELQCHGDPLEFRNIFIREL